MNLLIKLEENIIYIYKKENNKAKNSDYPMMLAYKYFNDKENDEEVERRMNYR